MAKSNTFQVDYSDEFSIVAIFCHLKDYRLTYYLNKALGSHLKKIDDLIIKEQKNTDPKNYSLYIYYDSDKRTYFYLVSNHHPDGKLFSSLKQTDYFLLIKEHVNDHSKQKIIKTIRDIPGVLTAYMIDMNTVKHVNYLLSDLEMHLMNISKR
ncbi:MAG: IPExxxVDY family protein [Bacteroidetes bacterium]|nr:IPExxxVDY family protein [Bacteroidota bacterium]